LVIEKTEGAKDFMSIPDNLLKEALTECLLSAIYRYEDLLKIHKGEAYCKTYEEEIKILHELIDKIMEY